MIRWTDTDPPEAHLAFRPRHFRPTLLLPGAHFQTVLGSRLRGKRDTASKRVRVETPDGDFLDLEIGPDPSHDAPIVLVLHGLEGSTDRGYMRLILSSLYREGILPVGMNFRSCSGVPNLRPRFYHSGETSDLAFILSYLEGRFPGRPLGVVGYSLGGNVLLRYLGELGETPPTSLKAAVAISVPFDLTEGTACLERGAMGRFYTGHFLRSLLRKVRAKTDLLASILDLEQVFASKTVRDFDQTVTAPLHGYADAWEYYKEASSAPLLPRIRVPTLLLHALDDPFLPASVVPKKAATENPWLLGAFPEKGGHVGFVEGTALSLRFWAEEEAVRYLRKLLYEGRDVPSPDLR